MAKKLRRNDPRELPGGSWYYIHPRSIELYAWDVHVGAAKVMLGEPHLRKMLSELTPAKKAKRR